MPMMKQYPPDHPLMKAWEEYRSTPDYANTFKWAADLEHRQGSLWAAFSAGFDAATERAAGLHEQINPASDSERRDKVPGADAMGAMIEYRDRIREPH